MTHWQSWLAWSAIPAALTLLSTLNLSLRDPSRVRLADEFDATGRPERLKAFMRRRVSFMLATAVLRSASVLALFIGVLSMFVGPYRRLMTDWPAGDLLPIVAACVVAWLLLVMFGVAIPYAWAKYSGEWLIARCMPVLLALDILCRPVTIVVELFDPLVRRMAGVAPRDAQSFADEMEQEILHAVSEGELLGAVDRTEKAMIESVMEFGDKRVAEIMTPRTEVVAVSVDTPYDAILAAVRTSGHSRIPVYDGSIDSVVGVLYAKDLLRGRVDEPVDVRAAMRPPLFIPESKPVTDLLREFQERKVHIAVVLDEYGGTAGLVTIEDIIEELVGDIADEYETEAPIEIRRVDPRTVEVDARLRVTDLNAELGLEIPEAEGYETIGGYVLSVMGRIPRVGDHCACGELAIHVTSAEPHRVGRLRVVSAAPFPFEPAAAQGGGI